MKKLKKAFPTDIEQPSPDHIAKNSFIFHDESTFNAKDDEGLQWGTADSQIMRPKIRIMVSDFVTENGYLCPTEAEHVAKQTNLDIGMGARTLSMVSQGVGIGPVKSF